LVSLRDAKFPPSFHRALSGALSGPDIFLHGFMQNHAGVEKLVQEDKKNRCQTELDGGVFSVSRFLVSGRNSSKRKPTRILWLGFYTRERF